MLDPRIGRHLIADQGEVVIDEVRKHWAAMVSAALELWAGAVVLLFAFFVPAQAWWVPALIGGAICCHALWRLLDRHMDRFVITNMRVFRVHGILSQSIATMPLSRILDISVHKPMIGRIFGYGHFVFESAAQEQGLRDIRYVGHPDERGLTIQRVIQQAGLRGAAARTPESPHLASVAPQPPVVPPPAIPAYVAAVSYAAEPPAPRRRGWLDVAEEREAQRLAELRGEHYTAPIPPFDPDATSTAPIDLPR
ncbi:membrane protein YdbS with pleckstrin-like domain [Microbacterium terrae]|uniref:Bacterial membrane flanked domain protein n=1 Tax=Microbacterium terrae TaxID=69369 RepID=A0A0M2GWK9_9MICO|nr:PH domain-containing protein [Microbacterium terrae]KJL38129.1 Bacterial membrane flanked domain protein [Microbacterium terrae]MBP1077542.1 membrane protein YdbS with pleckstrin-like domain [Microbacterium terrae]GLJ99147.1 hypothetical protein GCM10017594_23440 [Microbacterium terrae]